MSNVFATGKRIKYIAITDLRLTCLVVLRQKPCMFALIPWSDHG